jgi:hypothetical protein
MSSQPKHLVIGGLVAMGLDVTGKFLLTVSHSGCGVFLTETWERVARNTLPFYPAEGMVLGIGPLAGQLVEVVERDEKRNRIELDSPDGTAHFVGESDGITITLTTPNQTSKTN